MIFKKKINESDLDLFIVQIFNKIDLFLYYITFEQNKIHQIFKLFQDISIILNSFAIRYLSQPNVHRIHIALHEIQQFLVSKH